MRTKFYMLMFLLLGGVSITMAQSHEKKLQIHFESDEFGLDNQDRAELKKLIQELGNSSYHEITITGHTDHDASEEYNRQLSNRRAQQVKTFLCTEGIPENRISMNWFGENKPKASNAKESGKKENRRVEIKVKLYDFKSTADVINQISETKTQVIEINPKIENKVTGEKGLEILIPANSLETEDGQAISPGPVKIELTEIYSDRNAIEKQISTSSNGQILETGGMFEVKATQNGKSLKLKSGKSMGIEMPSKNLKEGMNVFVAEKNANGITEWKITSAKFNVEPKKRIKYPFTKVNTKLFLDGKKEAAKGSYKSISYYYKIPKPPVAPTIPVEPKRYALPKKEIYTGVFDRIFTNKVTIQKRFEAEIKRREKLYQDKLLSYNKKMLRYQAALVKYKQDSINYEFTEFNKFKTWLNNQKEACEFNIHILETNAFNNALSRFVAINDSNQLFDLSPMNLLLNLSKVRSKDDQIFKQSYWTKKRIIELEDMNLTQISQKFGYKMPVSLFVDRFKSNEIDLFNNKNSLMTDFISQDAIFNELEKAADDILAQRTKLGLVNQVTTNLIYRTTLSNFGMYNCDRFATYAPEMMVKVNIPYKKDAQIYFQMKGENSLIYAYKNLDGYNIKLPKNKEFTLVLIGFDQDAGPVFLKKNISLASDTNLTLEPESLPLKDIKLALAKL